MGAIIMEEYPFNTPGIAEQIGLPDNIKEAVERLEKQGISATYRFGNMTDASLIFSKGCRTYQFPLIIWPIEDFLFDLRAEEGNILDRLNLPEPSGNQSYFLPESSGS